MKGLERDLIDASESVESIVARLPRMTMEQKVDAAARLGAVSKSIEDFDKSVKTDIKNKLKHKDGSILGGLFKAVLKLVSTDRFNQKEFKKDELKLFKEYTDTTDVERVTFEPR